MGNQPHATDEDRQQSTTTTTTTVNDVDMPNDNAEYERDDDDNNNGATQQQRRQNIDDDVNNDDDDNDVNIASTIVISVGKRRVEKANIHPEPKALGPPASGPAVEQPRTPVAKTLPLGSSKRTHTHTHTHSIPGRTSQHG